MIDYITLDEFKTKPEYQDFLNKNSDIGSLKINVYTAGGVIPLSKTHILITKRIGNYNVLFYNGVTNVLGVVDNIVLPTPPRVTNNTDIPEYTLYEINALHLGYEDIKQYTIAMFGNTKVIQYIRLAPEVK